MLSDEAEPHPNRGLPHGSPNTAKVTWGELCPPKRLQKILRSSASQTWGGTPAEILRSFASRSGGGAPGGSTASRAGDIERLAEAATGGGRCQPHGGVVPKNLRKK